MKENKNTGNIFKQKFENFDVSPPEHIWNEVQSNIPVYKNTVFTWKNALKAAAVIIILAGGSYLAYQNFTHITVEETQEVNNSLPSKEVEQSAIVVQEAVSTESIEQATEPSPTEVSVMEAPLMEENLIDNAEEIEIDTDVALATDKPTIETTESIAVVAATLDNDNVAERTMNEREVREPDMSIDHLYSPVVSSQSFYTFGAYLNPYLTFFPEDSISSLRNIGFDVSGAYHFSNFFVETGVGLSMSKDEGNYTVDYQSYDLVGAYDDVYEVVFDSTPTGVQPVFLTKSVELYDTIRHISISKTKNTYTYLHIPLLFGYQHDWSKVSLSVKGGPLMSLLVYKHVPPIYIPDDVTVLNVQDMRPSRMNTMWQGIFTIGLDYRFSDKFSFSIEPTLRYHFSSAYNDNTLKTSNPMSLGIRTGFKIRY